MSYTLEDYKRSQSFAQQAHAYKLASSDANYYKHHLEDVCEVLQRFGFDPETHSDPDFCNLLRIAGQLHDVLEDTPIDYSVLEKEFSTEVAKLVFAVTDEGGSNRIERKERTYPKIKSYGTPAIILKLADRIANVESCLNSKDSRYKMYLKEKSKFEEALRVQGELTELWDYLNSLFL
jgi:GTP pyrophosphokinase